MSEKTVMVKCPGCSLELPENDLAAQMTHMDKYHPEIIAQRRREAGMSIPQEMSDLQQEREV